MARVIRGEGDSLQQRGQLLFRQGNYQDALSAFTEALHCKGADVMGILDNRVATYIKLKQYDRALTDSRQMIKRDEKDLDGRGVLRYGQTLLLTGDYKRAQKAYGWGLNKLPMENPRRKTVLQMFCKVRDRASVKRLDPFAVLPLELAMMVLQHFTFRQLAVLLRVSKGWQRMLSQPDLWMQLDFTEARRKVQWRSFRAFVQRSRAMLTHAVMTNISTPFQDKVLEYLGRCPKLEHLEIRDPINQPAGLYDMFRGSTQLKSLVIGKQTPVAQEYIAKFLTSLPQLERIEIQNAQPSAESKVQWPSHLPNLRSIALLTEASIPPPGRVAALYIPPASEGMSCSMPNLEEIRLDSYPRVWAPYYLSFDPIQFPRLRRLDLKGVYIGLFSLPPSLEHLSIHAGAAPTGNEFPFHGEYPPHLPNLHTLRFRDLLWVTFYTLHSIIVDAKAPLRSLMLDRCPALMPEKLHFVLVENSINLTELGVSQLPGLNDTTVKSFVESMSNLTALDISGTDVTGRSLKMLADARSSDSDLPQIEHLYVRNCDNVPLEAITYARSHGLKVIR
ncbi:F-box domain protein [Aspergillus sclerotioniger CBS 115572]|uniref:F-box domain protein n=1 Tax=Aspergillus sclerotioniger CBS 115572 TaxID=1450535 RepID=A0A317X5Y6_9EURO|nr:F-box domain protein [Aspergillus sclerotioniger CBS 115572]PWY94026.1 F-box domain protein [Aspergillus sclerotioniger CBS 115572]